eukprot:jgi/Botrbrau1/7617/Bobra.0159s0066.1
MPKQKATKCPFGAVASLELDDEGSRSVAGSATQGVPSSSGSQRLPTWCYDVEKFSRVSQVDNLAKSVLTVFLLPTSLFKRLFGYRISGIMASVCTACTSAGSCKCTYGKPGDECTCGADCKCPSCPKAGASTVCAACVTAGECKCTYAKPGDVCSCGADCGCASCPKA